MESIGPKTHDVCDPIITDIDRWQQKTGGKRKQLDRSIAFHVVSRRTVSRAGVQRSMAGF